MASSLPIVLVRYAMSNQCSMLLLFVIYFILLFMKFFWCRVIRTEYVRAIVTTDICPRLAAIQWYPFNNILLTGNNNNNTQLVVYWLSLVNYMVVSQWRVSKWDSLLLFLQYVFVTWVMRRLIIICLVYKTLIGFGNVCLLISRHQHIVFIII